jgi:hypothetical protein
MPLLLSGAFAFLIASALPPLSFAPVQPVFALATEEYRQLWRSEGERMIQALEGASGFDFPALAIEVFVSNGTPSTSYDGRTIWLKGSYPEYFKRATLMHELGHRLAFTMPRVAGLDDHRLLYLFLFDAWSDLYGPDFAGRMADIESRIAGRYDYAAAWRWARTMTREQRQVRLQLLRGGARTPPRAAP